MGEIVDLKPTNLESDQAFVADCCRFQEGILSEANMRRKYGFANSVWERLGDDLALLNAVEEEKIRRQRSGLQKREKSQLLILKAPDILDGIASDSSASPRHRVDAIRQLDSFTSNPQEGAAAAGLFQITINLGGDHVEHYSKSITVDPNNGEDAAPVRTINYQTSTHEIVSSMDDLSAAQQAALESFLRMEE